ncbi:nitrilotriacetate monooxygenase component A [Abditibacteriota bacterium]|nr:nitrilotriacetate monooxygenase component A [Abditibacteriota bacterium]
MSQNSRHLRLNLFLSHSGQHAHAARLPSGRPDRSNDISLYIEQARAAEDAKLDSLFLADGVDGGLGKSNFLGAGRFEPFNLFTAITSATEKIGVIMTASTTFYDPFTAARSLASLDHLSDGRAGWNVVTSRRETETRNMGFDSHPGHSQRYERAREFVDVTKKLWDSWDDDALVFDQQGGVYADPAKVRAINHRGPNFAVDGPNTIPRPVQGYPVLVQAGASDDGREFAAQTAEAIFTAQNVFEDAQEFYGDVKSRMTKYGRSPEELVILPGLCFVLGRTEEEALARQDELLQFVDTSNALERLSQMFHVDLTGLTLDDHVPFEKLPPVESIKLDQGRFKVYVDMARRDNLTLRQIVYRSAGGRGHNYFVGTPLQMVDHMEKWLDNGAADGFNLMPGVLPTDWDFLVNDVLPELRRRGLFRDEYTGSTLREHYRLQRPENQFTTGKTEVGAAIPHSVEIPSPNFLQNVKTPVSA